MAVLAAGAATRLYVRASQRASPVATSSAAACQAAVRPASYVCASERALFCSRNWLCSPFVFSSTPFHQRCGTSFSLLPRGPAPFPSFSPLSGARGSLAGFGIACCVPKDSARPSTHSLSPPFLSQLFLHFCLHHARTVLLPSPFFFTSPSSLARSNSRPIQRVCFGGLVSSLPPRVLSWMVRSSVVAVLALPSFIFLFLAFALVRCSLYCNLLCPRSSPPLNAGRPPLSCPLFQLFFLSMAVR